MPWYLGGDISKYQVCSASGKIEVELRPLIIIIIIIILLLDPLVVRSALLYHLA